MIQKYLAYLKAVETGSITRAAERLGYTQSAVSRMIADLEEQWGVPLLKRNRTGIEISSEGMQLLPRLQAIAKEEADLSFAVSELHGLRSGLIRIGSFTSMSTSWMPEMIKAFHLQYPNISFQIFNGEYQQIATWLRRGMIDCGFLALSVADEFETEFLLRDSLTVILPPAHPLRDAPCFPVSRLSSEDFISLKEEQDYEIDLFLDHLRQSPNIKFEVSNDFEKALGPALFPGYRHCRQPRLHPLHHHPPLSGPRRKLGPGKLPAGAAVRLYPSLLTPSMCRQRSLLME